MDTLNVRSNSTVIARVFGKLEGRAKTLPKEANINPLYRSAMRMQAYVLKQERPTVGVGGTFLGNSWPALAKRKAADGTEVPVWGGTFGGRDYVAVLRADGVRRYRSSDPQLDDLRAGGMLGTWFGPPRYTKRGNWGVQIASEAPHADAQAYGMPEKNLPPRGWFTGSQADAMKVKLMKEEGGKYLLYVITGKKGAI